MPFKSIYTAIRGIPETATCHLDMLTRYKEPREPYNPKIAYAKCITTSGGANAHWNGLHPFTPRQMAGLQTFRNSYEFVGKKGQVKTQVGNAIPPAIWRHFVGSIKQTLEDWMAGKIDEAGNRIRVSPMPSSSSRASSTIALDTLNINDVEEQDLDHSTGNWIEIEDDSTDIEMNDGVIDLTDDA